MLTSPSIWSLDFWKAATERAVATAAQSAAAYMLVDSVRMNALMLDWSTMGGIAAGGAVFSLFKSLAVNAATKTGPSLTEAETVAKPLPPIVDEL